MINQPDFFADEQPTQMDFFEDQKPAAFPFLPGNSQQKKEEGPATEPGRLAAQSIGLTAKYAKYPFEAVKQLGYYGALADLDEMESRGVPVDREKYIKDLNEANEALTGEKVEKFIEEKTGLPLEPKSNLEKNARELFEFASLSPEKIFGKLGFGAKSKVIKDYLVENEIPEPVADLVALGMASKLGGKGQKGITETSVEKNTGPSGGPPPPGGIEVQKPNPPGPTIESEIGKQYGLRPFAGTEIKEPRGVTPVISRQKAKSVRKEVTQSAENVAKAIIREKIPAAKAREQGLDLKEAYDSYYDVTRQRASQSTNPVSMRPVINNINKEIAAIEEKVPSPSSPQAERLRVLKRERKKLMELNPDYKEGPSKILDQFGNPISEKKISKYRAKKITAQQTTDQFHAYNENVNASYRKSQMTGLEKAEAEAYHDINDWLVDAMESSGNKDVARPFSYANEIFKQTKNLQLAEKILGESFRTPNGLRNALKGNQRGHLERALGREGVHHLDKVATYQTAVFDKLKDFVLVKDPRYFNIRKVWENLSEIPGRIAGMGYTGKNIDNTYINFQKKFLAKDYIAAEKEAEKLIESLGHKTIEAKPKEISSS